MKILITGATTGTGKQLGLNYQATGHAVSVLGRNEKALKELKLQSYLPRPVWARIAGQMVKP